MSVARMTSLSAQTLSLLLERQRLQSLSPANSNGQQTATASSKANSLSTIVRNLGMLRLGITVLEGDKQAKTTNQAQVRSVEMLKNQYERMRGMLGEDAARELGVLPITPPKTAPSPTSEPKPKQDELDNGIRVEPLTLANPFADADAPVERERALPRVPLEDEDENNVFFVQPSNPNPNSRPVPVFEPYRDEPGFNGFSSNHDHGGHNGYNNQNGADDEPNEGGHDAMHQQRLMMEHQDTQLEGLSVSIGRQHHISLQINEELDTHTGLLDGLDTDLENTGSRLGRARHGLDRVSRGIKGNGSTFTIAGLIFILLILIIVFKT